MEYKLNNNKKDVKDYFSQQTRYWRSVYAIEQERLRGFRKFEMQKRQEVVLKFLDEYALDKQMKVLDIGCGPGGFIENIINRGHKTMALDISNEMVTECKQSIEKIVPGGAPVLQADVENLPFLNDSFDVIFCIGVLQYLNKDYFGLNELSRILKSGGVAIITVPNILRLNTIFDPYYYIFRGPKYLWLKLAKIFGENSNADKKTDFKENIEFKNRRYFFRRFKSQCENHNLLCISSYPIGFGPLTIWRRQLLPFKWSLIINNFLEKMTTKRFILSINHFASRWVFCFKKLHK